MIDAHAIRIVAERGKTVTVDMLGADGSAFASSKISTDVFERMWDVLGMTFATADGMGDLSVTFELRDRG